MADPNGPPPLKEQKVPFGNGGATSGAQVRAPSCVTAQDRRRRIAERLARNIGVDLGIGIGL